MFAVTRRSFFLLAGATLAAPTLLAEASPAQSLTLEGLNRAIGNLPPLPQSMRRNALDEELVRLYGQKQHFVNESNELCYSPVERYFKYLETGT